MTLLTPVALFGLLLLPVLVVLHLRRRTQIEDVSSLLIWRDVLGDTARGGKRLVLLSLPLLLLQALAVTAIVLGLARAASPSTLPVKQVYVLDDSIRMAATDLLPNRLAAAKAAIEQRIAAAPRDARISIVVAAAQPYILAADQAGTQIGHALDTLTPSLAPADLPSAPRIAGKLAAGAQAHDARIVLVYPLGEPVPTVTASGVLFSTLAIGRSSDNQAIDQFSAQCTTQKRCEIYASVRNEADVSVVDPIAIEADGAVLAEQSLQLPSASESGLSFTVPSGRRLLQLVLTRRDILPRDNVAWLALAPAAPVRVTLVGDPARTAPLQRALALIPGVTLRVRTPRSYSPADALRSDLLIAAGWLPSGALPAAPALLLVDPPRLPGGQIEGSLDDATITGLDSANSLLADVDLTSLDVPAGVASRLALPPGIVPVVRAADGPLLAAGSIDGQQVAVLAFDPQRANLSQLAAFPVLLRNLVRWSGTWLPAAQLGEQVSAAAPPGTTDVTIVHRDLNQRATSHTIEPAPKQAVDFDADQPGVYTVTERGAWGTRTGTLVVNLQEPSSITPLLLPALVLAPDLSGQAANPAPASWWPVIGLLALLLIVAEWLYVVLHHEG